jgi:AcrR family transcriptional regulator
MNAPRRKRKAPTPRQDAGGNSAATRETILETAERLFAHNGLEATSIRDITAAARANLGAINYHFGTKQKLVEAVFLRRIAPVNERRLELLNQAEAEAGLQPLALEKLLEAMIRPAVERSFASGEKNTAFMLLMARCHSEPNPRIERLMRSQFEPMMTRYGAALARILPGLPPEELFWRLMFTSGALLHSLLMSSKEDLPSHLAKKMDAETLVQRLVAYAAAGMKAPVSSPKSP